ncbi:disulfide bond formation protein B [Gilvimarinus polysaccharolyticus]|uniref:disulfide bond formation protein B n=1 Tax=Gilvimarinus polysaccharolyticus TaxID=863921 RepID=UPI0006737728|nr:disulfide bond formation protein B [Gilvimarinus polysaccharolyticus]
MASKFCSRVLLLANASCFWWAIAGLMLALEVGALLFQHVWQYYPCEVCIYVRVWVAGLFFVALIALLLKRYCWGRLLCVLSGLALAFGLANESWNLVKIEYGIGNGSSCAFKANFPSWAPLDAWLPSMFEVQDFCKATPELLFGITMTHMLVAVSVGLIVLFGTALLGVFFTKS